jgi:hypothetical protein
MRIFATAFVLIAVASAQPPVAPTPEMAGSTRGDNVSGYNIIDSVELGYRFASTGGNYSQYQSMVNYHDGLRVLGSYFTMNSKDGHGKYFDELVLTTSGLGNDPYENATLRIQKNKLYRYDMMWRRNDYVNPGLTTDGAAGTHSLATQYDMQDHDFVLFPDSKLKFFLGFTGSSQNGPALSSVQIASGGDIYPLFANVKRVRREYRVGNEFVLSGFRVNWIRGWEDFKEDTPFTITGAGAALYGGSTSLIGFQRAEPYHGTSPYWRVALFRDWKNFSMNGRFTYTGGQRAFVVDENSIGAGRFGAQQNLQTYSIGNAQRPVATGNFTVSWIPAPKLTVVNSTSVYNVRTEGDAAYIQFNNATQTSDLAYYNYLGIRTVSNETDVNYQATPWMGVSGGYQYSNRLIRSVEQTTFFGTTEGTPVEQTNQLHAGTMALRLRPYKGLSILLGGEIGRNDRPFSPTAGRNYHALNAKVQYKYKTLMFTGAAQSNYVFTPVSLSAYSSESRTYSVNGSYTPRDWLGFDAGYTRMHVYSLSGIAYFANFSLVQGESSLYLSNINSVNIGVRLGWKKRGDLYLGFSGVQDVGDGRATAVGAGISSTLPALQAAQTFPMQFESPSARLSIRLREKLRWNFGYQYYGYREKFYLSQGYRANTGFTSLTFSF